MGKLRVTGVKWHARSNVVQMQQSQDTAHVFNTFNHFYVFFLTPLKTSENNDITIIY